MKGRALLLENPAARRRRGVGLTLTTLLLVALLLLCSLPFHRHDHPDHFEASPFVIDAEAGLLDHLVDAPARLPASILADTLAASTLPAPTIREASMYPELAVDTLARLGSHWWEGRINRTSPDASKAATGDFPAESQAPAGDSQAHQQGIIESGQTASILLSPYLQPEQIHSLAQACKEIFSLTQLRAGQPYALTCRDGAFERLEYEIDANERLVVERKGEEFAASIEPIEYEVSVRRIAGVVEVSLFNAVTDTGESAELAMAIADIFGWEVDFIRDLRQGDSFSALVEKRYRDGEFAGYGRILAAEFVNQGHSFQGYLYEEEDGHKAYYDAEGNSLKRAFLKAPLSFTRVSSGFSWSRKHPILGYNRPHPAIDYAAPSGAPVMSVGDGRVAKKGWDNGGGNFVTIRHGNGYETTYMHLSRFAKGLKQGDRVDQGQVIAYVGATGLATGPHLDFRMKHNGKFINPSDIENPRAESLDRKRLDAFRQIVAERSDLLLSRLATSETQEPESPQARDTL